MDAGMLVVRVIAGLLLAAIGTKKLFGWFGGSGLRATGRWFASMGFVPGTAMAAVAGGTETLAGCALVLGLLTPLASAAICGTLVVAMYTHRGGGVWTRNGGFELALLYATCAAGVGLSGAGRYSLDALLDIPMTSSTSAAAIAIGVAVLGSAAMIVLSRVLPRAGISSAAAEPAPAAPSV